MPVDWRVRFDFDVAADASLAGESDFFAGVAEDFDPEQRVEQAPQAFEQSGAADFICTFGNDHVAAAACAKAHAIHDFVGPGIQLHAVFASDGPQVFTFCGVNSDFFVDKLDLGHDSELSAAWMKSEGRSPCHHASAAGS